MDLLVWQSTKWDFITIFHCLAIHVCSHPQYVHKWQKIHSSFHIHLTFSLCQSVKIKTTIPCSILWIKIHFLQRDNRESHTLCFCKYLNPCSLTNDRHVYKFYVWLSLLSTTCEWINSIIKDHDFYRYFFFIHMHHIAYLIQLNLKLYEEKKIRACCSTKTSVN